LWAKDPAPITKAYQRLQKGENFAVVSRELTQQGEVRSNLNCIPSGEVDPVLRKAVTGLKEGQHSTPFDLQKGKAIVLLTTDKHRRRAAALFEKGDFAQAEKELDIEVKLHPTHAASWHLLAMCRTARGDHQGALKAIDNAVAWSPRVTAALLHDKATILFTLGRRGDALFLFQRAFTLAPNSPRILSSLAWALAQEGRNLDKALKLARRAVELAPNQKRFQDNLSQIQRLEAGSPSPAAPAPKRMATKPVTSPKPQKTAITKKIAIPKTRSVPKPKAKASIQPKRPEPAPPPPPAPKKVASIARPQKTTPQVKTASVTQGRVGQAVFLQVSSYQARATAQREVKAWQRLGLKAWVEASQNSKNETWYRVLLGPYPDKSTARQKAQQFKQENKIRSYRLVLRPSGWAPPPEP
jgi:tetratricopeptide (TPR) repeat protein